MFARWHVDDVASGSFDWQVWDVAAEHDVPLFACPDLHAKVYVADHRALVGSANATPSGLAHGRKGNVELLLEVGTSRPEVADLIDYVHNASSPAPPLGPDVRPGGPDLPDANQRPALIWIPHSDPESFLEAIAGQAQHSKETKYDHEAIGLRGEACNRSDIVSAVREMTAFRLVRRAFQTRMIGMRQEHLIGLLSEQLDPSFADLPVKRLNLLAQWLGLFGENTHLAPTAPHEEPILEPGGLLSSHRQ